MSFFFRYGGFCPQFKYQIGETFGKTTSKLLRDDAVASSGQLVLAEIRASSAPLCEEEDPRTALLRSRTHSWGDQKLMEQMIPGYTGITTGHLTTDKRMFNRGLKCGEFTSEGPFHTNLRSKEKTEKI